MSIKNQKNLFHLGLSMAPKERSQTGFKCSDNVINLLNVANFSTIDKSQTYFFQPRSLPDFCISNAGFGESSQKSS